VKINVGMLTAQLASYEPELGMHPLVRCSRPGPANFQQAQPGVIPALRTGSGTQGNSPRT